VYIVPLRIGGGTQDFRSDSDGISRRCHPHRCRGLAVTDGDDILLADSPEDFATRTVGLMTDSAERKHIGCAARNLVENRVRLAGSDRYSRKNRLGGEN